MAEPDEMRITVGLPNSASVDVVIRACRSVFGKPLVVNSFRALLVEAMIAEALSPIWAWTGEDWAGWDFQDKDRVRLEVKQSAARQTWTKDPSKPSRCSFDIAARTGHWVDGDRWTSSHSRNAEIYIFAHHPVTDGTADHRDPYQWRFYVASEASLPSADQKSISLSGVQKLAEAVGFKDLSVRVELVRAELDGT